MIFEHTSYRDFLKQELVNRKQTNPAYSMRAMAKQLGFSSSQLSEAMNGKANFSIQSIRKISKKLKLQPAESRYFILLGMIENETNPETKESLLQDLQKAHPRKRKFSDLSLDHFRQISNWYHSAILELVSIENFEFNSTNIAKSLGVTKLEAELALDRLVRLSLLEKDEYDKYTRNKSEIRVIANDKNAALRTFYRQMLERASIALENQNPSERWSGYETLAISESALPEVRGACDRFFDEVIAITKKHNNKTKVYHLLLHFFNLAPKENHK